jgi:hypothetical protein
VIYVIGPLHLSAVQESVARVVEGDPEPDNAYQILALVESQAKRDGHPSSTVTAIVNKAKIGLAENLKKGVIPSVKKQAQSIDKSGGERER